MARSPRYGAVDDAPKVKARNDVYTGLLALSLIGMIISCILLGLDYAQYGNMTPEAPKLPPPPAKAAPAKGVEK